MDRRTFLGSSVAAATAGVMVGATQDADAPTSNTPLKGRLKQSVCRWCYSSLSVDQLCEASARIGLKSVELLTEAEWPIATKYGLQCAVASGPGKISVNLNQLQYHKKLIPDSQTMLMKIRDAGIPNMLLFSGNREPELSDTDSLAVCARALEEIIPIAETVGVTVLVELLNSKVDHRGYQADNTPWGVELAKRINSPRFKLLYDIYHMQIMEGDVIRTIRDNIDYIGHFHTGGVPGRAEIDDGQELYYPAICKAIVETGYDGYLGQEFIPRRDPIKSLEEAARICDV